MVIYLSHLVHGTKVATSEMEAVADEANGWKRFNVANIPAIEVPEKLIDPTIAAEREELTKQYVERFGRKPHWKSSIETIKEELCQPPST